MWLATFFQRKRWQLRIVEDAVRFLVLSGPNMG